MSWLRRLTTGRDPATQLGKQAGELVTYADWSQWFEAFAEGGQDDYLLSRAAASTPMLSSGGLADTFARRASETLGMRLDGVGLMLQSGLSRVRTDQDAVRAILNARNAFVLLRRYAELPCWSEALRSGLASLIEQHMAERQKTLLRNAAADRSGRLAAAIRNNPLDRSGPIAHRSLDALPAVGSAAFRARRPLLP